MKINESFLNDFENRLIDNISSETYISDIILKYSPQFKKYFEYFDILEDASETYQKLLIQFPQIAEVSYNLQVDARIFVNFDSLSITPIQRVPRYILLINEILKHTPFDHENRDELEKCLDSLKETVTFINDHAHMKYFSDYFKFYYLLYFICLFIIVLRRRERCNFLQLLKDLQFAN